MHPKSCGRVESEGGHDGIVVVSRLSLGSSAVLICRDGSALLVSLSLDDIVAYGRRCGAVGEALRDRANTVYVVCQQGDGSTVWIQTTMLRDMGPSGSMQTSSYYNVAGQGQLSGYAHSQQPTHGHAHPNAAYSNLYHPSQIGPAPSHQILQQPQGMGSGGGNNQAGAYQRTQRAWNTSNY